MKDELNVNGNKIERSFRPTDRYYFDFRKCSKKNGYAQVDTSQDAHYFGTWANPVTLKVITYLEGDVNEVTCDTPEAFANELRSIKQWNTENGHTFKGIDTLCDTDLDHCFESIGLGDLLY